MTSSVHSFGWIAAAMVAAIPSGVRAEEASENHCMRRRREKGRQERIDR
jgi:hypothetical protein